MPSLIANRTYAELSIGDSATLHREVRETDIQLFAAVSGDINPAHLDAAYAADTPFQGCIAHGIFSAALISTLLGVHLPGPGTIYLGQTLRFLRPVRAGDRLEASVTVREKHDDKGRVVFDCLVVNQEGRKVLSGEAEVIAPASPVRREAVVPPPVTLGGSPYLRHEQTRG
ncbi:MAG: MaoC/PaaZ C-terminal domain-containing protein [Candidatus Dactylopiibacterium sp.]|nr:MaoC/PaaZ C-terminal domain-containing protein [Candidatus Dactylopiibacterium sp.]